MLASSSHSLPTRAIDRTRPSGSASARFNEFDEMWQQRQRDEITRNDRRHRDARHRRHCDVASTRRSIVTNMDKHLQQGRVMM
jgi:hypothetical protein